MRMRTSLVARALSFRFAFAGLAYVARSQPNFRIHLLAALLATMAGLVAQVTPLEWAILSLTIGLVLAAEAVNTAIEAAVDAIDAPPSVAAKHAKDAAAGAVLIASLSAVVVGLLIFGPRLWALKA